MFLCIYRLANELSFLLLDLVRERLSELEILELLCEVSATTLLALIRLMRCRFCACAFYKMASLYLEYLIFHKFMIVIYPVYFLFIKLLVDVFIYFLINKTIKKVPKNMKLIIEYNQKYSLNLIRII